jgi:cell division protein FtsA
VTNDLAIGLRVSLESAEKIKYALSLDAKKKSRTKDEQVDDLDLTALGITETKTVSKKTLVEGIIRPRLNEIFTMVKMELDRAGVSNRIPSGAIITGGGAETVGVIDSARRTLSLPVRVGLPFGIGGLVDDVINPAFSVCVGLILCGIRMEPKENLNSFSKKFKLPSIGIIGKLFDAIKNLLP